MSQGIARRVLGHGPAEDGFTVVETIIVLAIAGLILLIVLLAIPTLTRNSRNNQRKQDAQAVLEYVSHYELNHSGDIPATADFVAANVKLTAYSSSSVTIQSYNDAASSQSNTNSNSLDTVTVYNYQRCAAQGNGTNTAAGFNDVAALYAIESGNTPVPQCQQL